MQVSTLSLIMPPFSLSDRKWNSAFLCIQTYLSLYSLGFDASMSRLLAAVNGTEYWLSAVVAMFCVERFGRYVDLIALPIG